MARRKADPIKHCPQCGKQMERYRREDGSLEGMASFVKKTHCSSECRYEAMRHNRPYAPEDLKQAYESGKTCKELAEQYGIGVTVIRDDLRDLVPRMRAAKPRPRFGEKNINWNGGRAKTEAGYILIKRPEHPNATPSNGGYVREHAVVACEKYGIEKIVWPQVVHHVDLDKQNNDPSNLSLMQNGWEHNAVHYQLQHCAVALMKRGLISYSDAEGYTLTDKALSL